MSARKVTLLWASLICFCMLDACGSSSSGGGATPADASTDGAVGGEGQPCYPNDTCNAGLACLSHLCVNAGTGGTAGAAPDGAAGTGGAAGSVSDGSVDDGGTSPICDSGVFYPGATCAECLSLNCCTQFNACTNNNDPAQTELCVADCSVAPPGPLCVDALGCATNSCSAECA